MPLQPQFAHSPSRLDSAEPAPRKRRIAGILVSAGAALAIGSFLWFIGVFGGNVHAVVPGRVYRSAELTGANLDGLLRADHIQTVINLRGGSSADSWYRSELASCRRYGAAHVDIPMTDRSIPPPQQLDELLDTFDHDRYPILFHCKAGADRSGLVGALYLAVYRGMPVRRAVAEELTWRYGHFSFGAAHAMDDFYRLYAHTSRGQSLRDWITRTYPALYRESANH